MFTYNDIKAQLKTKFTNSSKIEKLYKTGDYDEYAKHLLRYAIMIADYNGLTERQCYFYYEGYICNFTKKLGEVNNIGLSLNIPSNCNMLN